MKLKLYSSIIILIITIFAAISFHQSILAAELKNQPSVTEKNDEMENIENLIIIDGLDMDSESSSNNNEFENDQGRIIYDNTFDDDISNTRINLDKGSKSLSKNKIHKRPESSNDILSGLQRKDKRWHLTEHKIRKGENLFAIARKYTTDHRLIINANNIKNPDSLKTGKIIMVPNRNGVNYKVCKGDTIIGICKKYKIEKNQIFSHNMIKKNIIRKDDVLFLPDISAPEEINADRSKTLKDNINYKKYSIETCKRTFRWPLKGRITSAFGTRIDPITQKRKFHCGLDIGTDVGTQVTASADGRVIFSGWKKGYGRVIILKHADGFITVYAHNSMNLSETGDSVLSGQQIALSGMSGAVTGSHLHFEIRKYLTPLNPMRFLK